MRGAFVYVPLSPVSPSPETRRCIGLDQMIWMFPVCVRMCIGAVRMEDSDSCLDFNTLDSLLQHFKC